MAAAPPPGLYSTLYNRPHLWRSPDPDYDDLLAVVGGASASDRNRCADAFHSISTLSPLTVCFVLAGDENCIYVGHSMTKFLPDVTAASAFDNRLMLHSV